MEPKRKITKSDMSFILKTTENAVRDGLLAGNKLITITILFEKDEILIQDRGRK